jgi:hypothetical protein
MSHVQRQNSENEVSHIDPKRGYRRVSKPRQGESAQSEDSPLKRQIPVASVYLTGYKSRSLSPSRVFTIVQR